MSVKTAEYREIPSRNSPSLFAAPVAWAVADFARALIEDAGGIEPHHTGLIVVSDECTLGTIRELARTAEQGRISPLRFAGASPSIVAGLAALQQGIRGPTLALTMPPEHAATAIEAMLVHWLRHGDPNAAIVIAHHGRGDGPHRLTGLIARAAGGDLREHIQQLCDPRMTVPA